MAGAETSRIKVMIAGRAYPLIVTKEEELRVRALEEQIKQKMQEFQQQFKTSDIQDCLAMILVSQSLESTATANTSNFEQIAQKIANIQSILS